ncbi:TonB-dependent receptor plug domain-containing protein [Lutibacter sp. TH_r2]|uniref:TonB-dependent receptor plug domain-containing protein n=1 Tax=Lutibacter sp. TH_r2 TaxID=3082083 RepID=UPI002955351E|nr:TonB-dependent receptor plug domain-containing protein [Lutibacter sp. TH_r2]MDV7187281.1 TonB-dependent receptor plug domain-containing protein [Lutibacter sp. TH_r2]
MERMKKYIMLLLFLSNLGFMVVAQENKVYDEMTLDELLDIDVVVTASKKPEDLFETPLSTTIISKEEIKQSGVTSIPEALRLSQGVIVREITPGNYDIHIRGYDDITKNVYLTLPYNTTTLVMIDNRVVYSYFSGGTSWESLPVDINDVERIEVVRGPASALYGTNAVTGVINIITSHASKKGKNILVNTSVGSNQAKNLNTTIGYNWNDKTKLSFSGNFTERKRFDNEYYDFNKKDYSSIDDISMFVSAVKYNNYDEEWTFDEYQKVLDAYYNVDLSLRKLAGNVFLTHNFSEQTNIDIAMGAQKSQSQKVAYLNFSTALSQIETESYYVNAKIHHKNFDGQFSINSGEDLSNYQYNSVKFTNIEANIEYFKQFKQFSIRPGLSYKFLSYNSPVTYDEPFSLNNLNYEFKDEPRETSSYSAFVLAEYKPTSKLRVIGAARVDKFGFNKNYFLSHEIASTYRIDKNNLIRFAHSRANKSPFFIDTYSKFSIVVNSDVSVSDETSIRLPVSLSIHGQEDLKYPTITSEEIGWRTKLGKNLSLDLELFYSEVDNFVNPNVYRTSTITEQYNTSGESLGVIGINASGEVLFENYNLDANQFGAGFTLNYNFSKKLKAKLYGTFQKTNIKGRKNIDFTVTGVNVGELTASNTVTTEVNTLMNPTQWNEDLTPSFFGGFLINFKANNKWNFSTDAYFMSSQEFSNSNYYQLTDEESVEEALIKTNVNSNLILNARASYQLNKKTSTNISFKNILGKHKEYGFVDNIGSQILIGLNWEF